MRSSWLYRQRSSPLLTFHLPRPTPSSKSSTSTGMGNESKNICIWKSLAPSPWKIFLLYHWSQFISAASKLAHWRSHEELEEEIYLRSKAIANTNSKPLWICRKFGFERGGPPPPLNGQEAPSNRAIKSNCGTTESDVSDMIENRLMG